MSNTTDKPEFGDWIRSTSGQKCLMWPISDPKYLENRLFWAFEAGRDVFWKKYINQKSLIASLESQLKEKDREIAALKEVKGMQLVSSEFENGYLREQIENLSTYKKLAHELLDYVPINGSGPFRHNVYPDGFHEALRKYQNFVFNEKVPKHPKP